MQRNFTSELEAVVPTPVRKVRMYVNKTYIKALPVLGGSDTVAPLRADTDTSWLGFDMASMPDVTSATFLASLTSSLNCTVDLQVVTA